MSHRKDTRTHLDHPSLLSVCGMEQIFRKKDAALLREKNSNFEYERAEIPLPRLLLENPSCYYYLNSALLQKWGLEKIFWRVWV